jgi:peptide/nickel transport system substrate-binding protein
MRRLLALIPLLAAGACSPGDEGRAAAPSQLVWGINNEPDTLNPVTVASVFGRDLCNLLFLYLADFGPPPDFAFEPELAESWEVAPDRTSVTFHLRRDVTWHDGAPTTAHDVKFTFDTISHPAVPYPQRGQIRDIAACEVLDDWTVRFTFRQPCWEPLYATWFHVVPRHLLETVPPDAWQSDEFGRRPVGNGRFRFLEWERGIRLVLGANDSPLGRPGFDRVMFRFVPEDVTLRTELLTGGVDVYHRYPHRFWAEDRENPELEYLRISDRTYVYIGWNLRNPIFADRRVREALTLAIDRQTIVDAFRAGSGTVVDVPVFAEHPDFNPNVTPAPFDPARAAALLDDAGWTGRDADGFRTKDGRRLEFTYLMSANNVISEEIATMTQQSFGALGVSVRTESLEFTVLLERQEAKDFDALILARSAGLILDPEDVFHSRAIEGRYNAVSFADAEVDSLIDLAKSLPDRLERRRVWWRLQETLAQKRAVTVLYVGEAIYPVRRARVENPVMDLRGPFQRLHEWLPARAEG